MKYSNLFFLILSFLFIVSCDESDTDLTSPALELLSSRPEASINEICGVEEESYALFSGDTLQLTVQITDNKELSEMKVEVHDNFDCHGHGGSQTPAFDPPMVDEQTTNWDVLDIVELSGDEQEYTISFPVPENVTSGFYHFETQVVDAAGNEAEEVVFDLRVWNRQDTTAPLIDIETPDQSPLMVNIGETITFKGNVYDNRDLGLGGNGVVFINYKQEGTEDVITGPFSVIPSSTNFHYEYELVFPITSDLGEGTFDLSIYAQDGVRNLSQPIIFRLEVNE